MRVGVLSNWVVWVCVWQAIIGAVAGVLLQSDFPKIVAALGSEEDKARLALLLQEVDVLQVDCEKEQGIHSEEEIKALQERREEAARRRRRARHGAMIMMMMMMMMMMSRRRRDAARRAPWSSFRGF